MQSPDPRRRLSGSLSRLPPPPPPNNAVVVPVFERFHSFKEFMLLQKDTLEADRAVQLYDQYRHDFKIHTARALFNQFQHLGFIKQRFDPVYVRELVLEKIKIAQKTAPHFLQHFQDGVFNDIDLAVPLADPKMIHRVVSKDPAPMHRVVGTYIGSELTSANVALSPLFGSNPNLEGKTLILKKLPGTLIKADLAEAIQDVVGMTGLSLIPSCLSLEHQRALLAQANKEPKDCTEQELQDLEHAVADCYIKSKPLMIPLLTAWLEFDTAEHCSAAELALEKRPIKDICTISPLRIVPQTTAPIRVCSIFPNSRLAKDYEQLVSLILQLDKEFNVWSGTWPPQGKMEDAGDEMKDDKAEEKEEVAMKDVTDVDAPTRIEGHPFLKAIESLPLPKRHDLSVLYLRRVHLMDFYSAKSCWSERELFETCGAVTVRLTTDDTEVTVIDDPSQDYMLQSEDLTRFEKKIQSILAINWGHWRVPIDDYHPLFSDLWAHFCEEKTMLVDSEKYRCGICRKLFKGAEFVHKHLKNKHAPEIEPVRSSVTTLLMKQAFEADDQKLLLFIQPNEDMARSFQVVRPLPPPQTRNSDAFAPTRRGRAHRDFGERPYRDWDAPKTRLLSRSVGGNFRSVVRYDDL
eukprot:Protomagalhaensia_wolfi_Nauph_80__5621@NODE_643_length_2170_cov_21_211168_g480_i0_p1_GENE_NODE_643_length_2170_cov_21_211168_g480_i0NODE_643_length_2170_cov_21_211168_g480_i0_p1_ORF_typecomplete_len640_score119_19ARS2/PF04959_13/2e18DUF3546/PF12066_8/5e09zfBED/PF02892_15/0_0041GSH_synthase/PF03199_15/1_6e04GSH_synthase/PF03199_15/0_034GSH_synthase/PF03199_15/1_2e04DUF4764/PF15961_5/1_8e04DUF4764/PF15961_5/0_27_NODE_643_length_2170_cov_21_211168_g480_i02502145